MCRHEGIHPRVKRPVGRRLAYAAARMLKQQQQRKQQLDVDVAGGAFTGPTISGCSYTSSSNELVLKFNQTLLGGEGLMLRPFDANETGGWGLQPGTNHYQPLDKVSQAGLGAMVCTVDPTCNASNPGAYPCGNATTCMCQSWAYVKCAPHNWYCEVGPGWKPDPAEVNACLDEFGTSNLGRSPDFPYTSMWRPAPLKASAGATIPAGISSRVSSTSSTSTSSSVQVDLSGPEFQGRTPIAVRYAWPLASAQGDDTCCPTAAVLAGRGVCIPGNCPLYSDTSELPANPFFATIDRGAGKCKCRAPQDCSE